MTAGKTDPLRHTHIYIPVPPPKEKGWVTNCKKEEKNEKERKSFYGRLFYEISEFVFKKFGAVAT